MARMDPERLERALQLAEANLGRSVVSINPGARAEAAEKAPAAHPFGVKNTAALPAALIERLRSDKNHLLLTVDKMADLGRSVDTDLVNPLTYRPMTGSTSGGPINILKGINDVCIGTDGGGSVLAPALATSLFSFLAKGVGLSLKEGVSTDGLAFTGGVGVIGRNFDETMAAAEILCGERLRTGGAPLEAPLRVVVPAPGCMPLPGGGDAAEAVTAALKRLALPVDVVYHAYKAPYDRTALTAELSQRLKAEPEALFLSMEGPIDVFGADETIPRCFAGPGPAHVAGVCGKGFVKAANLCGCSGFTVPCDRLASGFVLLCPPGLSAARRGCVLAEALAGAFPRPEVFERYFILRKKQAAPLELF